MSDLQQTESTQFDHCEQCNAPVDQNQRYCVNCGSHRRHVPDPAAKFMSRTSAHTGAVAGAVAGGALVKGAPARGGLLRPYGGGVNLLGALAIALIPVAAAIGVGIGRSSNNQDQKVIAALEKQRSQVSTVVASGTPVASSSAAATTSKHKTSTPAKRHATAKTRSNTTSGTNQTANGTASKITGTKVTAKAQAEGGQEAQKIEKSTGSNYVQGSNSLPSQVVVGP